jgi:hypothetical protein
MPQNNKRIVLQQGRLCQWFSFNGTRQNQQSDRNAAGRFIWNHGIHAGISPPCAGETPELPIMQRIFWRNWRKICKNMPEKEKNIF